MALIHIDGISNTEMIQQFIIGPIQTLKNTENLNFPMLYALLFTYIIFILQCNLLPLLPYSLALHTQFLLRFVDRYVEQKLD
ncbi:hypothetical protein [Ectobacillus antri]|uniref:hypothetical protein n=1 Tax=Ectobacillus antri TaxID=2486280 RepID=UPI001FE3F35A